MKALEILLGYACNEKCSFCSQEISWRRQPWIPFESAAEQLFLAAKAGYRSVCFTGGEPTLHRDLAKMVALAKRLEYRYIRIQTNGVRLEDPEFSRELTQAGANFFRISIHGHKPEIHDSLVRLPGALKRALSGARHVLDAGARVGVNYVLNAENIADLPEAVEDLLGRGLSHFVLIYPLFEGDFVEHESKMRISMNEAAPQVRRAFDVFKRRNARPPWLLNFTPCAAPELTPFMLSWSAHSAIVVDRNGRPADLYMASHDDRRYSPACEGCALHGECLGFKTNYLKRFPEAGARLAAPPPAEGSAAGERILRAGAGLFDSAREEVARAVQPVAGQELAGPLRVERMTVHLDPATGQLEEERSEWGVTPARMVTHA